MADFPKVPLVPVLSPSSKLDQEKAREKFKEFWTRIYQCPVCGSLEWDFGPDLVQLAHFTDISTGRPFKTYPAIVVICRRCGYMMLFNAGKLGLANV